MTYGIDSTAKLWRASVPVDPSVDDSPFVSLFFGFLQAENLREHSFAFILVSHII